MSLLSAGSISLDSTFNPSKTQSLTLQNRPTKTIRFLPSAPRIWTRALQTRKREQRDHHVVTTKKLLVYRNSKNTVKLLRTLENDPLIAQYGNPFMLNWVKSAKNHRIIKRYRICRKAEHTLKEDGSEYRQPKNRRSEHCVKEFLFCSWANHKSLRGGCGRYICIYTATPFLLLQNCQESRREGEGGRRIQQQVGLVERVGGGGGVVGTTNTASSYTYTILAYSFSLILLTSQRAIWVSVVTFSREQKISRRK